MAISYIGGTYSNSGNATSLALPPPASTAVGDLLVITISMKYAAYPVPSYPTGFSAMFNGYYTTTTSAAYVLYKIANASDLGRTVSVPTKTGGSVVACLSVWRGVDNATPFLTDTTKYTWASGSTPSGWNVTKDGSVEVIKSTKSPSVGTASSLPGGTTNLLNFNSGDLNSKVYYRVVNAGTTGALSNDMTADINVSMVLNPAPTLPTVTISSYTSTVTTENASLTFTEDSPQKSNVQYHVLVNGVERYSWSAFSTSVPAGVSNLAINNSWLNIGHNTVTVEVKDTAGLTNSASVTITKNNSLPVPDNSGISLTQTSIHNDSSVLKGTLTDANGHKIQYKVSIGGKQVYPASGFTTLASSPLDVAYTIQNSDLQVGANTIRLDYQDELGGANWWSGTLNVTNAKPTASLTVSAVETLYADITVSGSIADSEGDLVSCRVLLNGVEKAVWTPFASTQDVSFIAKSTEFQAGDNTIKVEYKDDFKANTSVYNWTGNVYKYPITPAVITIEKETGQAKKGEDYDFPFSIDPPYVKDYTQVATVTNNGALEDGTMFSAPLDIKKFNSVSKIEVK